MKVPVVLITGFLGSGKTSLLNGLMQARPPAPGKLAIIVNELGDVGIDGDLLPAGLTKQVELPGGCICCVLNEDLDKTLLELIEREPELETIVIETTGVAEPMPIAWSLEGASLAEKLRLAAVVTLVDAVNFAQSFALSPAVRNQVEFADILVVTKLDLIGAGGGLSGRTPGRPHDFEVAPPAIAAKLEGLNPHALQITGPRAQQAVALWSALADPELSADPHHRPKSSANSPTRPGHSHSEHLLETVSLPIEGLVELEELEGLLEELPANYVRIKAIAEVVDPRTGHSGRHWAAIHRVGLRVSSEPIAGPLVARLVALGRGIQAAPLRECLTGAMLSSVERHGE